MSILYQLIVNPFAIQVTLKEQVPKKIALFVLCLVALLFAANASIPSRYTVSVFIFLVLFLITALFLYSTTVDFVAQLMGLKAQSTALFFWMAIKSSTLNT